MKILVTGAAGFIGMHLSLKLLELGHTVVGIDNINDYYDVNLKYARLRKLGMPTYIYEEDFHNGNFSFVKIDITNNERLKQLFENNAFDTVCNLAAQAGVRYSITHPESYIQSNLVGFYNILEACRNYHIEHLVYASSSSVYGCNTKVPYSINDKTDSPVSLYAATKKAAELLAYSYTHLYGFKATGLRLFTVYG
ncbi:MAG: NAD-dependent epimerase/dehydratase family protein, partial [Rikenellaceae bacterium]